MENKKEICKALLPVLQMTRNLSDLTDLEYLGYGQCDGFEEYEVVVATFAGGKKIINVTMDSGTAMIKDIISHIV